MRFMAENKSQWGWAFYDWANSAFATTVMVGFFPIFFKEYWASDLSAVDSTFWLGIANSTASITIVILAPLLGALCDRSGLKKRLLLVFAALGVVMTGGLFMVSHGHWELAALLYLLAAIGFSAGNVAYDSLLVDIAPRNRLERISSLGYAMGYLGGGLLFALNVFMVIQPEFFGLADASEAVRWAFLSVAVWWAVFTVPVLFFVEEADLKNKEKVSIRAAFDDLRHSISLLKQYPQAAYMLFAYWLYIDGVDTIARMSVDYGLAIGFDSKGLLTALLINQVVSFPAALAFGYIGERLGAKHAIAWILLIYSFVVFWAWQMQHIWEFYVLAVIIGLIQGGVQALSRALYARLIPAQQAGRFFGLYNMMGKFAVVVGPLLVAWVGVLTGDSRSGLLSVLVLFLLAAWFLSKVDVAAGERQAQVS